jgi:hypothetical protein
MLCLLFLLFQEHSLKFNLYTNLMFKYYETAMCSCYNGTSCIQKEWRKKNWYQIRQVQLIIRFSVEAGYPPHRRDSSFHL